MKDVLRNDIYAMGVTWNGSNLETCVERGRM